MEIREDGEIITYYIAANQRVARRDGQGLVYYHQEHGNSTRLLTDGAGAVANRYDYSAYGGRTLEHHTFENEFTFADGRNDDETGLLQMGARFYNSKLGRFVSADSIVPDLYDPQALDRYAYVQNDPLNYWDPTGHMRLRIELKKEVEARGSPFRDPIDLCGGPFAECTFRGGDPYFVTTILAVDKRDGAILGVCKKPGECHLNNLGKARVAEYVAYRASQTLPRETELKTLRVAAPSGTGGAGQAGEDTYLSRAHETGLFHLLDRELVLATGPKSQPSSSATGTQTDSMTMDEFLLATGLYQVERYKRTGELIPEFDTTSYKMVSPGGGGVKFKDQGIYEEIRTRQIWVYRDGVGYGWELRDNRWYRLPPEPAE